MCGRYTLTASAEDIAAEFGLAPPPGHEPRYNIAPQQDVLVLGLDRGGRRRLALLRWGLVPSWTAAGNPRAGQINARAETIAVRPTFRDAFRLRRCLIVADGFYEWRREGRARVPFRFRHPEVRILTFAGLWEPCETTGAGPLYTCAIVTTAATDVVAPIHDRMPAILMPSDRAVWIDPHTEPGLLADLLKPGRQPDLEAYEVSSLVNSAANESPACIEPV